MQKHFPVINSSSLIFLKLQSFSSLLNDIKVSLLLCQWYVPSESMSLKKGTMKKLQLLVEVALESSDGAWVEA